jgi:hypothetical protein
MYTKRQGECEIVAGGGGALITRCDLKQLRVVGGLTLPLVALRGGRAKGPTS